METVLVWTRNAAGRAPRWACTSSTVLAAAFAVALLFPVHAGAQAYIFFDRYAEEVMKLLPPYCRYAPDFRDNVKGANNPAEIKRWEEKLYPTYMHIHHWCYGLAAMNHAQYVVRTKEERDRVCIHMLSEATYVIERSPPKFVLNPEFYTMRGKCALQLNKLQDGFRDLYRAKELKPDYWPPYVVLSDYWKRLGEIKKAREVLQEGLSSAPESKTLKAKLAELGAVKDQRPDESGPAPKATGPHASPKKADSPQAKEPETPAGR